MDSQIERLLNEIQQLVAHMERETNETEGYTRKGDYVNALRNANESRDEMQNLTQKYQQLVQLLNNRR
jgi:t-SNARE complex subunit (syntaxin)